MHRRQFIRTSSLGLLAFSVGGSQMLLTPRQARAQDIPLRVLDPDEAAALEALGEGLLPGAREAGIAHYVDHQLAAPPAESLLMIRYLDVPPPWTPVYKGVLAAADGAAQAEFGTSLSQLDGEQMTALIGTMVNGQPEGWQGPPAGLAYFFLRNDAVDVVYGTKEGFARLEVPYMAHIDPPSAW